jgi:hypothetical protein
MRDLEWSMDLKEVVTVQNSLTAEEALDILAKVLLGDDYYSIEPAGDEEANAIVVRDILSRYQRKRKKFW